MRVSKCLLCVGLEMAAGGAGLDDVIPDAIEAAPPNLVSVEYTGGLKLETGAVFTPTQVKDQPVVSWPVEEDGFYTLMMIDPDGPSREDTKLRNWLHWLVGNVPGCKVKEGEEIMGFVGSGPPKDTGLHRYVFIALKQPGQLEFQEQRSSSTQVKGRETWDHKAFISKHHLQTVAANYYKAEWDEYVPKLYATFEYP